MTLRRFHMAWLAVAFVYWTNAAPLYYTPCLERLARLVGLVLPDTLGPGVDNDSTWSFRGRALHVRTNAYGDVSHIGYKLFDSGWASAFEVRPVLDFVERYALEEDVVPQSEKAELTSRKAVTFLEGNAMLLKRLTPQTPVRVNLQERRAYQLEWGQEAEKVNLLVSADCQSILGVNLIELEEMLERDLCRASAALRGDSLPVVWRDCPLSYADSLAVADGGVFLSDKIRSRVYLRMDEQGACRMLMDSLYPRQTLNNILLTACASRPIPLRLTIDKYGYIRKDLDVTLQQFVRYCESENCRLYLGIKEHTEAGLTATLFAVNTGLAYCHTLSLHVPAGWLQDESLLTGTLYAFTPLQNVTEQFFINNQ